MEYTVTYDLAEKQAAKVRKLTRTYNAVHGGNDISENEFFSRAMQMYAESNINEALADTDMIIERGLRHYGE